jgi:two-component system, OmpR family, sensor histidine kinase KdpD
MERVVTRADLPIPPRKWGRVTAASRLGRLHWPWSSDRSATPRDAGEPGKSYPRESGAAADRVCELKLYPIPAALGLIAATTGALIVLHGVLPIDRVTLVYLVPVMVCAAHWGLAPALVATIAAVAAADFFFYPPLYTFNIDDPCDLIDLILFSCVAVVTSELAVRLRRAAEAATLRETEIRGLYELSRRLAACTRPADIYAAIRDHLANSLQSRAVLVSSAETLGAADAPDLPEEIDAAAREIFARERLEPRLINDPRTRRMWLVRSVSPEALDFGVIAVDLGAGAAGVGIVKQRVERALADAASTLARLDVARLINEARQRSETDLLRKALLGSVSHELRTPLASIIGAGTILADVREIRHNPRLNAVLQVLQEEAERLNGDIQNLLDATRITNESVQPQAEWVDLADIVNAAVERRRPRLAGRRIELRLPADLPLVKVEARLIEQAFGHILENAAKYSSPSSTVAVRAVAEPMRVVLSVHDEGLGLTREELDHMWERSFRGGRHPDVGGTGLGLWIARAFVEANGGSVEAMSTGPRCGTTISIALPVVPCATEEAEEVCDA